jgi:hypothetical protein
MVAPQRAGWRFWSDAVQLLQLASLCWFGWISHKHSRDCTICLRNLQQLTPYNVGSAATQRYDISTYRQLTATASQLFAQRCCYLIVTFHYRDSLVSVKACLHLAQSLQMLRVFL